MPQRDFTPAGAPTWIELFTSDPARTRAFYCELFGWQQLDPGPDYGGYVNLLLGDAMVAGSMVNDGQSGAPDGWSVYLDVANIEVAAHAVESNGGHVMMPPMAVMDLGKMAVVGDPGGGGIGMWQAGTHKGFGVVGEHGSPSWFELHTRAYDASVPFYRNVFSWTTHVMSDTPEFRYTTLGEGDGALAGIMDGTSYMAEWAPAQWKIYFRADDVDATVARALELGGSVVEAASDTPYGRLAELADPTGITFRLQSQPAS
jgi:uncharacterized protein